MCNWFQNKSPTHTFAVDWDTRHGNWAAPCYFNGASPTGSARWGYCLQRHLACEGLYWNNMARLNSFIYTSGHCRRWRSRMEVKIMTVSLFVHCKIAYFYSVTAEKWLIVSLSNFVTIWRTHFSISCKIFSWIRSTKLQIHAMEFCDFIKGSVSPSGLFVPCSLTVTSTWRPRLTAHCPIGERH